MDAILNNPQKIIIIDDDQFIRESYQELLTQEGYEVIVAKDGQEGLDLALQQKPNLVLLDIKMPGMDGFGVFNQLKASGFTSPVIFLTNAGETENLLEAKEGAAASFMIKSNIKPEELIAEIKRILS